MPFCNQRGTPRRREVLLLAARMAAASGLGILPLSVAHCTGHDRSSTPDSGQRLPGVHSASSSSVDLLLTPKAPIDAASTTSSSVLSGGPPSASGFANVDPAAGGQKEDDFVVKEYRFASGEALADVRIHYTTLGAPHRDARGVVDNAILLLHGTTGRGKAFLAGPFRQSMFGAGQPFDTSKFFVVLPDDIGHGASSKPSDGLHARFPHYGYADMVDLEHRLVVEALGLSHLHVVAGTSMGGMHTWMWCESYPDFMDAAIPIASTPVALRGRNLLWRRIIIEATRSDPGYEGGEYSGAPHGFVATWPVFSMMVESTDHLLKAVPDVSKATDWLVASTSGGHPALDANDAIYALDASRDYDPEPHIDQVRAPILVINFADDQIVGPSLRDGERVFRRIHHLTKVVVPASETTRGHLTLGLADQWSRPVAQFLDGLR